MTDSLKYPLVNNDSVQDQHAYSPQQQQPTPLYSPTTTFPPPYQNQPPAGGNIDEQLQSIQQQPTTLYGNLANPITNQPNPLLVSATTVVTTQPKRHWRTGLGDCCKDCSVCMCVWCCGLCYSCVIAQKMGESGCVACCPGGVSSLRTQYRVMHHIEGNLYDDLWKSCCCHSCVLCQIGNDMKSEGYPKICCC